MYTKPRKRFGQNFLVDPHIVATILEMLSPKQSDHFFEIGPGLGVLTQPLLARVGHLTAIEIDRDLVSYLKNRFTDATGFNLISGDILKYNLGILPKNIRVVSNLPYNISTAVLFHVFQYISKLFDVTVMLQKEVVDRLEAKCGTNAYGRLTVMTHYHCQIGQTLRVPPEAFKPAPKVESKVIQLRPYRVRPFVVSDYALFSNIVRDAFSQRRKQLKNALKAYLSSASLSALKIESDRRPEAVSLEEYVMIANRVFAEKIL